MSWDVNMRLRNPELMDAANSRLQELVVEEAEKQGGFREEVARKFFALYWGDPNPMTLDEAADHFSVARTVIEEALCPITTVVFPRFAETEEAKALARLAL